MENLCESPFWSTNLTWETTTQPDFTPCFQETVLAWLPCFLIVIFAPFELISIFLSERKYVPVTKLNSFKVFLTIALIVLSFSEFIETLFYAENKQALVHYVSPIVRSLSYFLALSLILINRSRGMHTSNTLFSFWLVNTFVSTINIRSLILSSYYSAADIPIADWKLSEFVYTNRIVSYLIIVIQLVLSSIADKKAQDPFIVVGDENGYPSPEEEASALSKLTFFWVYPLMWRGFKRPLTQEDLYSINNSYKTGLISQHLDTYLQPQIKKALEKRNSLPNHIELCNKSRPKSENLDQETFLDSAQDDPPRYVGIVGALFKTFWLTLTLSSFFKLIGSLLGFASPLLLDKIITFVRTDEPAWRGIFYSLLLFFASFVESIFTNKHEYLTNINIMLVRTSLTSLIYRKTLVISNQGRKRYTTGQIVNLMSVDTQRIADLMQNINNIWAAPLQLIISMILLYQQLGLAVIAGLAMMLLNIPFSGWITYKMRVLQLAVMKQKDQRIKLLSEILNGIRIIKIHAWEDAFRNRIESIRGKEIESLTKQTWYAAGVTFSFVCLPFMVALTSFAFYVLIDSSHILDANKVFVSLSLFNILRIPLAILPMVITNLSMSLESIKRINKYLEANEIDPDMFRQITDDGLALKIDDASFKWTKDGNTILENIDIRIPKGKLIAIVGQVGSGKSSLISAMLGNMEKVHGNMFIDFNSSVSYVPQEAWILDSSLKENILLNKVLNEDRYQQIIDACALRPDLEILHSGDQTNAQNMSGGQKQRVSLARAVYADSDFYFMDDPLNAVDAQTGRHIFDKIIGPKGILKYRTRVLVTNKLSILPEVDYIVVMKDGKIDECGTYEQLLKNRGALSTLLVKHLLENSDEQDGKQSLQDATKPDLIIKELERIEAKKHSDIAGDSKSLITVKAVSEVKHKSDSAKQVKDEPLNLEVNQVGSVGLNVHMNFIRTLGFGFIVAQAIYVLSAMFTLASNIWLSEWANDANNATLRNDAALRDYRLSIYAGLGFGESLCVVLSTVSLNIACLKASKVLHNRMLARVLRAPLSWFNAVPSGRILNRFSKDIDTVDTTIRFNVRLLSIITLRSIVSLILISIGSPFSVIPLIPIVCLYFLFQIFYVTTSRQLKRIESATKSPIYSHFSETILGTQSIRAFKITREFTLECNHRVDINNMSFYIGSVASRWLAIRLSVLGYVIILTTSMVAVLLRDQISAGIAGLSVTYSLTITTVMSMLVRMYSEYETNVVSVERLLEYTRIDVEPEDDEEPLDPDWPTDGKIQFDNYSTKYRPELDFVLKKLNVLIKPSEMIGIIGRTGSGKSSIALALFRILEPIEGQIIIDDVNISRIDLKILRSKLSIIPQEPILFTGTVRQNVDPTAEYPDSDIWRSLDLAHLGTFVRGLENKLDHEVQEGGSNFSVGQKQLFCLARTLLRRSKIIVLDEATASVDVETDELIQKTIRKEFKDSTILTIAHRLETVQDCDRILIMDSGTACFK